MDKKDENRLIRERIIYFLEKNNMSLNQLATLSDLRQSTLNSIINGSNVPTVTTIRKICEGLNIPVIDFFNFYPYNQISEKIDDTNDNKLAKQILKMSQEIDELKKMIKQN